MGSPPLGRLIDRAPIKHPKLHPVPVAGCEHTMGSMLAASSEQAASSQLMQLLQGCKAELYRLTKSEMAGKLSAPGAQVLRPRD